MGLITIGFIIIVTALFAVKTVPYMRDNKSKVLTAAGLIFLLLIMFASVKQVEPGMVGVQKLFGKVSNNILESGLNLINPLVKVVMFDIRTENYTMSGVHDEGAVREMMQYVFCRQMDWR